MKRRIALAASRTLALYGFAGWVYIVVVALVEPNTLGLQLTHFAKFPREDTFGEVCFVVSVVSFFVYNMLRSSEGTAGHRADPAQVSSDRLITGPGKS